MAEQPPGTRVKSSGGLKSVSVLIPANGGGRRRGNKELVRKNSSLVKVDFTERAKAKNSPLTVEALGGASVGGDCKSHERVADPPPR